MSGAGDLDGDGFADLPIGASYDENEAMYCAPSEPGTAYVVHRPVFGGMSLFDADVRLDGIVTGQLVGDSVASAGDVDGDGRSDLIVGAGFVFGFDFGHAYLVYASSL